MSVSLMTAGREHRLVAAVLCLLFAATWYWAGLRRVSLPWFTASAAVLLVFGFLAGREWCGRGWLRDAFFWFGLLFLGYLGLQWWNSGRSPYFDVEFRRWAYTPPRAQWLPWAFSRPESAEMLHWFFPAWVIGLMLRSAVVTGRGAATLLRGVVYGAGLLAAFGIVQYLAGARRMYWASPLGCGFFASFGYTNHAAAYFVMAGAVAAGLLFREVFKRHAVPRRGWPDGMVPSGTGQGSASGLRRFRIVVFVASLLLCLVGANLSLSRAGVILAWTLALFVAGYGLRRGWRGCGRVARFNLALATVAAAIVFYLAVSGFGSAAIRREFAVKRPPLVQAIPALAGINLDLSVRPILWRAGWSVFREYPWRGVGGWGYAYTAACHLPPDQVALLGRTRGMANVHNDPIQFLAEFGVAGGGLLALALGSLLMPLSRRDMSRGAVFTMTCAGLALVVVFSLVDIPFRCPAILWTWVALLAALPKAAVQAHV